MTRINANDFLLSECNFFASIRVIRGSLSSSFLRHSSFVLPSFLIRRHFGQLRRQQAFFFLFLNRRAIGRHLSRRYEYDQILLDVLIHIGTKRATDERNVPQDGDLILGFLHVFAHQPTQHHRLSVSNADARCHLARAEHRLVDHIRGELDRDRSCDDAPNGTNTDCVNGAAVINETLKFHDLRNQVQVYRLSISPDYRFHLQSYTGVASFPILGCRRCDHNRDNSAHESRGRAADRWNLRLSICPRITKFSNDFDDGALAALCRHLWRREKIDPFLLV